MAAEAVPATEAEKPVKPQKSALVLGWFYAEPRQLKFVARLYRKQGFTDVVTYESHVATVARPRGWYSGCLDTQKQIASEEGHPLAREFDVVHVMSGGFLNLYQLLFAGVAIEFKTLVLDSTPILPKPAAFTRFARAYLDSVGFKWVSRLLPRPVHQATVTLRWAMQSAYIKFQHQFLRLLAKMGKRGVPTAETKTLNKQATMTMTNRYVPIIDSVIKVLFEKMSGKKAVFVYNPSDPFINSKDVQSTMDRAAKEYGVKVQSVEVEHDHVQTLFKEPTAIFGNV